MLESGEFEMIGKMAERERIAASHMTGATRPIFARAKHRRSDHEAKAVA